MARIGVRGSFAGVLESAHDQLTRNAQATELPRPVRSWIVGCTEVIHSDEHKRQVGYSPETARARASRTHSRGLLRAPLTGAPPFHPPFVLTELTNPFGAW